MHAQNRNISSAKNLFLDTRPSVMLNETLSTASEKGNCEYVKLLLNDGADVHAGNDYAIRLSAKNGYYQVVKLLLENGANVHAQHDYALGLSAKKRPLSSY